MQHSFHPSQIDATRCIHCKYLQTEHVCEVCGATEQLDLYMTMLFCSACLTQEKLLQDKRMATAQDRVDALRAVDKLLAVDQTIQVSQDIHNAKIASINELKQAIDADESIVEKHFTLAKVLEKRYKHLVSAIAEKNQQIKEEQNEQRAIHTYWNELSKKLKLEEREQIKLTDVKYQPPVKAVKKQVAPTVKKYDKAEIRRVSTESKIPEALIQMTCVARTVTPLEAVRILREAGVK